MLAHELIESVGRRLLLRIEVHAAIGIRHALHAIDELVALRIEGRDAFRLIGLQLLGIDIVGKVSIGCGKLLFIVGNLSIGCGRLLFIVGNLSMGCGRLPDIVENVSTG